MPNSTIIPTRSQSEPALASFLKRVRQLTNGIRRGQNSGASYLDTGHLDDHVLKDIGLDRSDLTKCE